MVPPAANNRTGRSSPCLRSRFVIARKVYRTMRLLVTGAAGMLGQDLVRAADAVGHDALGLAREDADIADLGAIEAAVREAAPDVVINCAGWTDVDGAEESPEAAYRANATGAGNVATAAARVGAWVV